MRYHINQENYHTFTTFRVNKLPARSYFIPYLTRREANDVKPKEKRYRSSKVICLNGKWDFKFYPYPAVLGHNLDTDRTKFDTIDISDASKKHIISFMGVASCIDLYVNGSRIKFHGVNHHETSPINGYTMTPDEIERDIKLCKDFNIDMIRTSHYPPDPLLLELCDEYGIYVIDENDLETHGVYAHKLPPSYNRISQDVRWKNHYLDRIRSLYERDKMHSNTSIVMWSLGNEAGGYRNTDVMYDYIKGKSSLPVHYENTYEQTDKGILVTSILHSINGNGVVPRFGKCFRLSTDFDDVAYNGRSGETYCDMRDHFVIEEVNCKVSDMTEPNIRPQESGNRCDCSWAEISDQKTKIRFSAVDAPFELAIKPYSDEALCKMRHRSDEIRIEDTKKGGCSNSVLCRPPFFIVFLSCHS